MTGEALVGVTLLRAKLSKKVCNCAADMKGCNKALLTNFFEVFYLKNFPNRPIFSLLILPKQFLP